MNTVLISQFNCLTFLCIKEWEWVNYLRYDFVYNMAMTMVMTLTLYRQWLLLHIHIPIWQYGSCIHLAIATSLIQYYYFPNFFLVEVPTSLNNLTILSFDYRNIEINKHR